MLATPATGSTNLARYGGALHAGHQGRRWSCLFQPAEVEDMSWSERVAWGGYDSQGHILGLLGTLGGINLLALSKPSSSCTVYARWSDYWSRRTRRDAYEGAQGQWRLPQHATHPRRAPVELAFCPCSSCLDALDSVCGIHLIWAAMRSRARMPPDVSLAMALL